MHRDATRLKFCILACQETPLTVAVKVQSEVALMVPEVVMPPALSSRNVALLDATVNAGVPADHPP